MPENPLQPGQSTTPIVAATPPNLRGKDAFTATLSYRPLNGGEVQQLVAYASTEDYAIAEVHQALAAALGQVQAIVPDTPAVRRFIAAASHMHDLRDALEALELAAGSADTSVADKLRVYAVVAFGRTYGSKARLDLTDFIDFSPDDQNLSARLKVTRNRFAAHSENAMTVTLPVMDLQRDVSGSVSIERVFGLTVATPMPTSFVVEFAGMIERLIEQLTVALVPLKEAVQEAMTPSQLLAVFQDPQQVQFVAASVAEWEPNGRRPAYPATRFTRMLMAEGEESKVHVTITR